MQDPDPEPSANERGASVASVATAVADAAPPPPTVDNDERGDGSGDGARASGADVVVRTEDLTKAYPSARGEGAVPALDGFSIEVRRGEILALVGPSGCGKTTLLRLIAGFEVPDRGIVDVAGRRVSGPSCFVRPEARRIGFVFQDYALFPHLDVLHNVAFGLTGRSKAQRLARAREVLDLVGLTIFASRFPSQLSGGQQQRVALARALAPEPDVILLDEPFSNLDAALRGSTRQEVRRILKRTGTTGILVTHDQEEAMTFADRLAVIRAGRLEQMGAPEQAYLRPRSAFVASFLGTTHLIRGQADGATADTPLGIVPLAEPAEGGVLLSIRPETLRFDPHRGAPVTVTSRAFKGHDLTYRCALVEETETGRATTFVVQTGPDCPVQVGDVTHLRVDGAATALER